MPELQYSPLYSVADLQAMATNVAASGLFLVNNAISGPPQMSPINAAQVMTLLLISQAEGKHPALALRDYDIIKGKPSKKTEAMMRDFLANNGKVEWHTLSDIEVTATFSHPQGGSATIDWSIARAQKAHLITGKDDAWKKYPRAMLRSRCVSEGVRAVFPGATNGLYAPEEIGAEMVEKKSAVPFEESVEQYCEKVAAEVATVSAEELPNLYTRHSDFLLRLKKENPKYSAMIEEMFNLRAKELGLT